MLLKSGVKLESVSPMIHYALGVADTIWRDSVGLQLTVTSFGDGKHSEASLHYSKNSPDGLCRAFDVRTRGMHAGQRMAALALLKGRLFALGFDVVDEGDHFHVEYDPKPGREFKFREVA